MVVRVWPPPPAVRQACPKKHAAAVAVTVALQMVQHLQALYRGLTLQFHETTVIVQVACLL